MNTAAPAWVVRVDVQQVHERAANAVARGSSMVKITPERLLALTDALLRLGISHSEIAVAELTEEGRGRNRPTTAEGEAETLGQVAPDQLTESSRPSSVSAAADKPAAEGAE